MTRNRKKIVLLLLSILVDFENFTFFIRSWSFMNIKRYEITEKKLEILKDKKFYLLV